MPQFDRLGNDMSDDIAEAIEYEEEKLHREGNYYQQEEELTGYEEHLRDSEGYGDARRCPRHPHVKTSSDDGMFDAPCGQCEYEEEMDYRHGETSDSESRCEWLKELSLTGPTCQDAGPMATLMCEKDSFLSCHLTQAAYEAYNLTHLELDEIPF